MNVSLIIAAGGKSQRYGDKDKLMEKIDNKEIIIHTLNKFYNIKVINEIIIVTVPHLLEQIRNLTKNYKKVSVIEGSTTRQKSVLNGLNNISKNTDFVIIHDGARPLIKESTIIKCLNEAYISKAAVVGVKTTDTIKQTDTNLNIIKTIDRTFLYNIQTPQIFEYETIYNCHKKLSDKTFTDDASMLEYLNIPVKIVEGEYSNIKITTKTDLELAKILQLQFHEKFC